MLLLVLPLPLHRCAFIKIIISIYQAALFPLRTAAYAEFNQPGKAKPGPRTQVPARQKKRIP
jgi:hypothetical protein